MVLGGGIPPAAAEGGRPLAVTETAAATVVTLEKRVNEVVGFYDGKKHGSGGQKAGGSRKDNGHSKGMPDLMRQFGFIVRQITSHEWAEPFLKPVDVVGLQLDDYYKVVEL
ncbi:hypothetical protein ABZP36_000158 [Zizania latifolia]